MLTSQKASNSHNFNVRWAQVASMIGGTDYLGDSFVPENRIPLTLIGFIRWALFPILSKLRTKAIMNTAKATAAEWSLTYTVFSGTVSDNRRKKFEAWWTFMFEGTEDETPLPSDFPVLPTDDPFSRRLAIMRLNEIAWGDRKKQFETQRAEDTNEKTQLSAGFSSAFVGHPLSRHRAMDLRQDPPEEDGHRSLTSDKGGGHYSLEVEEIQKNFEQTPNAFPPIDATDNEIQQHTEPADSVYLLVNIADRTEKDIRKNEGELLSGFLWSAQTWNDINSGAR